MNLDLRDLFSGPTLRHNAVLALVVGTVLSAVNQLDMILTQPISLRMVVKVGANFLIPFTVASISTAMNRKVPDNSSKFHSDEAGG